MTNKATSQNDSNYSLFKFFKLLTDFYIFSINKSIQRDYEEKSSL